MLLIRYLVILVFSSSAFAVTNYSEKYTYYDIYAKSENELREQMSKLGPTGFSESGQHFDASTTWSVSWKYSYFTKPNKLCYISDVNVNLEVTYFFPSWVNEASAEIKLRHKWDSYLIKLLNHENGHAINGENAAAEIEKTLSSLKGVQNCDLLQEIADIHAHKIVAKYNTQDIIYDESTGHGVSQGAVFP